MFLGASAFCRKWSSSRKKCLQRFDKNATKRVESAIRPTPTNTTKRTSVPSKAVQSLPGLGKTHLQTIRSPGTNKKRLDIFCSSRKFATILQFCIILLNFANLCKFCETCKFRRILPKFAKFAKFCTILQIREMLQIQQKLQIVRKIS